MDWRGNNKMKAYIFSIGEPTTDLCIELMEKYGFEVVLYQDQTSLWNKLKRFYTEVMESTDKQAVRIDADIIPNKNVSNYLEVQPGWVSAWGYDWYKQDRGSISIHAMHRDVIKLCLDRINQAKDKVRPETYLWRHPDINNLTTHAKGWTMGIHGYGQQAHRDRIKALKDSRGQAYDWELVERIEAL